MLAECLGTFPLHVSNSDLLTDVLVFLLNFVCAAEFLHKLSLSANQVRYQFILRRPHRRRRFASSHWRLRPLLLSVEVLGDYLVQQFVEQGVSLREIWSFFAQVFPQHALELLVSVEFF